MKICVDKPPPGTGVMYDATCLASSKSTSPHNLLTVVFVAESKTSHDSKIK